MRKFAYLIVPLATLVLANIFLLAPEALRERMVVYDSAAYIATGAFFLSVIQDIASFASSPLEWAMAYFQHYPGFSIRRYGPLFGLTEGAMYGLFGVSAVTAKMTMLLFSTLWIMGWFLTFRQLFRDNLVAFLSTLLLATLPLTVAFASTVRLDLPSQAFFAWGCYYYARYLDGRLHAYRYATFVATFLAASLYVYTLPIFGILALFLYMLVADRKELFVRPNFHITLVVLFLLLLSPLVIFLLKFAPGMYTSSVGQMNPELSPWIRVESRYDLRYWTYYAEQLWRTMPVLAFGISIWLITRFRFRPGYPELFFLLWFLIGYLVFSYIPSKEPRFLIHFAISLAPLTVIGIRDALRWVAASWMFPRQITLVTVLAVTPFVIWNLFQIPGARGNIQYVAGVDKVADWLVAEGKIEKVIYFGRFDAVFSFYVRKYDDEGKVWVTLLRPYKITDRANSAVMEYSPELGKQLEALRSAVSLADIEERIYNENANLIIIESENLDKGRRAGIYDEFYAGISALTKDNSFATHLVDLPVSYGKPGKEREIFLQVFQVLQP